MTKDERIASFKYSVLQHAYKHKNIENTCRVFNLSIGMGFIAVALVYFGAWNPLGIMAGALFFSTVNAFQLWMQVLGVPISYNIALMLPYLLTIAALVVATNRVRKPAALNKPFKRGEN